MPHSRSVRCGVPAVLALLVALCWPLDRVTAQVVDTSAFTMGSLVLLRSSSGASAVPAIRAALAAPDPGVRAVASRLVAVGRLAGLVPDVIAALSVERDKHAAAEQVRTLIVFGSSEAAAAADAYVAGADRIAILPYAEGLARARPDLLLERLPMLIGRLETEDVGRLLPAVQMAGRQHPAYRERLVRAWLEHAPASALRAFVVPSMPPADESPDVAALHDGLSSERADVREAVVWAVIYWMGTDEPVPQRLLHAALPVERDAGSEGMTWEAFGRELVARGVERAPRIDRSAFLADEAKAHERDADALAESDLLSRSERSALRRGLGRRPERPVATRSSGEQLSSIRTADVVWPGFIRSLFAASGCESTRAWTIAAARVTYAADGLPTTAGVDRSRVSDACAAAVEAIAQVAVADSDRPVAPGAQQWIVMPTAGDFLACTEVPFDTAEAVRGSNPDLRNPRKVHDASPAYPADSQNRRVSGVVVIEAAISRTGCIDSARVVRSVETPLDIQALRAVVQWRYSPALMNGTPVPVVLTVMVNFTLR